jgi:hypothetical protein
MYKSRIVKLVFLNSVLAFSACSRPCEPEPLMKDGRAVLDDKGQPMMHKTCRGSGHRHGRGFIYVPVGGVRGGAPGGRPGAGSVGRGGFGTTGHGGAS